MSSTIFELFKMKCERARLFVKWSEQFLTEDETAKQKGEKSEEKGDKDEVTESRIEVEAEEESEETPEPVPSKSPVSPEEAQKDVDLGELMDPEEMKVMKDRILKLEKEVICLQEKVNSAPMAGVTGSPELDELVSKIQGVQTDMKKLNQTADRLIDDRENREMHLNVRNWEPVKFLSRFNLSKRLLW